MLRVHTDIFMKVYWYSINSVTTMVVTLSEKVIRKRKATFGGDQAPKRPCVKGPPVHERSFLVRTTLEWKVNERAKKVPARLLLDSGCTGPVMSQNFIKKHGIPGEAKRQKMNMVTANGQQIEGGTHNTKSIGVWIRKHVSDMKFESLGIRD